MTKDEALDMALEALEESHPEAYRHVITAIKQARALDKKAENARELGLDYEPVAAPVQEPVAWTLLLVGEHHGIIGKAGEKFLGHPEHYERIDVYTTPPAQPAVPDAIIEAGESPEFRDGWNECRETMLQMLKARSA
jgi:ABC-type nitrate/sulfonate/bicarbonate transport system substrate-binding protein